MKRVLIVFPTSWDRRQLESCRAAWADRYQIEWARPTDEACPWDFDVPGYVQRVVAERRGHIDGVFSSSDYPGATTAAAIATELGLPGPRPEHVLCCSHKHCSRLVQRRAVPEATPAFERLDPDALDPAAPAIGLPCFVKPVKGAFSVLARKIRTREELRSFLSSDHVDEFRRSYLRIFDELVRHYGIAEGGRDFIAEALLHGRQATVEGFVADGRMTLMGISDSILHPRTKSFARFDYPSSLPREVQERMADIADRAIRALQLDWTLFNIEMIYEPYSNAIAIIEVNPRLCGQFGDLYAKVDGRNAYEMALELATGEVPASPRGKGPYRIATSFPMRAYEPLRAERVPDEQDIGAAEALYPGTLVWNEIAAGDELSPTAMLEDGRSFRYGIVNVGGGSRSGVRSRFLKVQERLGYRWGEGRGAAPA